MKTIIKLSAVVISVLSLASCHKDLDIIQTSSLTASNMWKNTTQVEQSTNAIYFRLRSNFIQNDINVLHWGELRVGEYMWGPSHLTHIYTARDVLNNVMTSSTGSCSWSALYNAIDQANAVLKYAPIVSMSDAKRGWSLGQAAFARAYCYFWAVRLWGDVPLNLQPIESTTQPEMYPSRTPKAQVYAQIEKDVALALENSANLGTDHYMATPDAVNMLKAEYALWMYTRENGGDAYLDMAEAALNAIGVKPGDSRFEKQYADIFDGHGKNNKNSKEVIFSLYNSQSEKLTGGYVTYFCYAGPSIKTEFQNNPVPVGSAQWLCYTESFTELMLASKKNNGDTRVDTNLGYGKYGSDDNANEGILVWPNKFVGDYTSGKVVLDADLLYYRYGLAVMMMAELKYYRGRYQEALTYLNMIASRAYSNDKFYTTATKDAVLQALCDEYFFEFPAEGVIWWALIRLDKIWDYNPYLKERKNDTNILLWPITKTARNRNTNLTQTEGWF